MRILLLCILFLCSAIASASASAKADILVLGDSLSAGYRLPPGSDWVTLLQRRLTQRNSSRIVVNASISGETSAGGLGRLPDLLNTHAPYLVIVELGANDGLRGLPVEEIRANLARIIKTCRDAGAKVLLLGIELPINYGPQYRDALREVYRGEASEFNSGLVPFMLEGVAQDPALMQDDGLHPTAAAEPLVLETLWPAIAKAIGEHP